MPERLSADVVRQVTGLELSDQEADALAAYYATLARGVAAFPVEELKTVEPALRSVPAPPRP
jgi:cytochrome c553